MIKLLASSIFSYPLNLKNQDSILGPIEINNGYLFAIADGVGGYEGGELAANIAISSLKEAKGIVDIKRIFEHSLNKINQLDAKYKKASTTLTLGYLNSEGLHIGHIGDCRLYIKQGNKLRQKTKDNTSHQQLLDQGIYTKKELKELSGKNIITTAISNLIEMKYDESFIPIKDIKDENNNIFIYIMSDGAYYFWENRPRFSDNTMNSVMKFSAALQKRIEKSPIDDYSLIAIQFKLE